jgi:hypothetical protein
MLIYETLRCHFFFDQLLNKHEQDLYMYNHFTFDNVYFVKFISKSRTIEFTYDSTKKVISSFERLFSSSNDN